MALTACQECKKSISTEAERCPHCGFKPSRTSTLTWAVAILVVAAIGMSIQASQQAERAASTAAAAEASRFAALTPEQKKQEEKSKVAAQTEQKRRDEAVQRASIGAKTLKNAAHNPDAFKLESALVIHSGAVCYEYRGTNSYGGTVRGQAVLSSDAKRFLTNSDDGFGRLWKRECAGQAGQEVATAIRWFTL